MILHSTDRLIGGAQRVHNKAYKQLQLYRFAPLLLLGGWREERAFASKETLKGSIETKKMVELVNGLFTMLKRTSA
jgi:hypothetical protein